MLQIVTANRLGDGRVVFLKADGGWSTGIADSAVADGENAAVALLEAGEQAEADCKVVGPYLIEVNRDEHGIQAVAIREAIRAAGPTIEYGAR